MVQSNINFMQKLIFSILVLTLILNIFNLVPLDTKHLTEIAFAYEKELEINFFYSPTCPHCAKEWEFFKKIERQGIEIKVNRLILSKRENIELLMNFYQNYKVPQELYGLVPITFIKDRYFVGFNEKIGKNIEDCILELGKNSQQLCESERPIVEPIEEISTRVNLEGKINLPIIGEIDIKKHSLPVLAVLLGALDGFNVCSLGALILILGLVLALRSRKKILIFGGLFIFTTALVYGFLIVLWYQIFSFLAPYMKIMEILIGILGIGGGIYFLRQFIKFKKQGPTCNMGIGKKRMSKFSSKFQKFLQESTNIFLLLGSVILFAGIITIVEFPCSAAVPVVFAGVLAQSQLSTISYVLYIVFYLLFYMLDEIIIFLAAFFTMAIWLASNKAISWITLAESIILFLLGFYYLFGFSVLL